MTRLIFSLAIMLVFISSTFGQYSGSHYPKNNPGKRVVAYVNNLAEGIDSSIYIYQTIYDTLASVVVREYTTPLEHFFGRDSIFYDDQNRVIAWNAYRKDSNDVYRIMTRRKTVFDDFTHSQVRTTKSYRITGEYYYGRKLVLEFDSNKNLKRESYLWNIDSARWELTSFEVFNEQGRQIESTTVGSLRVLYEYDASGVLLVWKFDLWSDSNNQFISYSKVENEVVDGKVVVSSTFFRNQITGIWRRIRKVQNFYNSSGLLEEEIHQKFVSAVNELVNAKKYSYSYDSQSRLLTKIQLEWIDSLNEFRNKKQEKYSYDDLLRVHTHTDLTWDDSSSVWNEYRSKVDYYAIDLSLDSVYYYYLNSNGEEIRRIDRVQFNADSTILSATQMSWDTLTNSWQLGDFQRWYYEDYDTLVPEDPFFLSVFPNPTTENIFIGKGTIPEGVEVFIYSEDGKLMVAKELKQSNKIYMEDWAAAVYFYVLYQDGRRISSGSILKQ